jgi:hypothetical protein
MSYEFDAFHALIHALGGVCLSQHREADDG